MRFLASENLHFACQPLNLFIFFLDPFILSHASITEQTLCNNDCAWYSLNSFIFQKSIKAEEKQQTVRSTRPKAFCLFYYDKNLLFFLFSNYLFFYFFCFFSLFPPYPMTPMSFLHILLGPIPSLANNEMQNQFDKIIRWNTIPQLEAFPALSRCIRVRRYVNFSKPAQKTVWRFSLKKLISLLVDLMVRTFWRSLKWINNASNVF